MWGDVPGNCQQCAEWHRDHGAGKPPPCDRLRGPGKPCPKFALFPQWRMHRGLHPANELAVEMYYKAARQQRVGMDGYLVWTLTPDHAQAVLDEYDHLFPTHVARQECFEKMLLIDKVATKTQGEEENRHRELERQRGNKGAAGRRATRRGGA